MKTLSSVEVQNRFGSIANIVKGGEPVAVTQYGTPTMMIHQGVRLLFVVTQMPGVDGIVTAADLQGEKPLRLVSQRQVKFEACLSG